MQASPDLADLVPQLTWGEGAIFLGYLAAGILAPGWGLVRLARLESDCRYERWALTAVLGTLWSAWLAFGLGLLERPDWHPWLVGIPLVAGLLDAWRRGSRVSRRSDSRATWRSDAPGLILVAAFAGYYLARVAAGVELDNQGLRLYGAWWSDKMTNLSPAFALLHKVPPPSLRMAGEFMPYHYFEHLFVATVARAAGIDVVRGFWFYASATGVAITGLAVVAFARRRCGPRLAWLGLVWFGLMRFGTETKAMDL